MSFVRRDLPLFPYTGSKVSMDFNFIGAFIITMFYDKNASVNK